jgi:hypothetical protein
MNLKMALGSTILLAATSVIPARADTLPTFKPEPTPVQKSAIDRALRAEDRGSPYRVAAVDLNGDGKPDLVAQFGDGSHCGSAGCSAVAVLSTAKGYASKAIDLANFQETIKVLDQRHHGMHDIRFDDSKYVFRWNGKMYR